MVYHANLNCFSKLSCILCPDYLPRNKPFFRSHQDCRESYQLVSWFCTAIFPDGNRIIQPDDGEVYFVQEVSGHKLVGASCALASLYRQLITGRSRRGRRTLRFHVFALHALLFVDFGHCPVSVLWPELDQVWSLLDSQALWFVWWLACYPHSSCVHLEVQKPLIRTWVKVDSTSHMKRKSLSFALKFRKLLQWFLYIRDNSFYWFSKETLHKNSEIQRCRSKITQIVYFRFQAKKRGDFWDRFSS